MMKNDDMTRVTLEEVIRRTGEGKTDWERLRREEEAGIEPERDPDEGEFDWSQAPRSSCRGRNNPSRCVWMPMFRSFSSLARTGCRTPINAVLRSYMKAQEG